MYDDDPLHDIILKSVLEASMNVVSKATEMTSVCPSCYYSSLALSIIGTLIGQKALNDDGLDELQRQINNVFNDRISLQSQMDLHQSVGTRNPQ